MLMADDTSAMASYAVTRSTATATRILMRPRKRRWALPQPAVTPAPPTAATGQTGRSSSVPTDAGSGVESRRLLVTSRPSRVVRRDTSPIPSYAATDRILAAVFDRLNSYSISTSNCVSSSKI